jgi:hypothetical protein
MVFGTVPSVVGPVAGVPGLSIFLVHGHDKLSEIWNRHPKADTITTLKGEDDSSFAVYRRGKDPVRKLNQL